MSLIGKCRAVLHRLGSKDMKVDWLRADKLAAPEVFRYATSRNAELRLRFWMVLNRDPEQVVQLIGHPGVDLEQLLLCFEAKPLAVASVICARLRKKIDQAGLEMAVRVLAARRQVDRDEILRLIRRENMPLFSHIHKRLR